MEHQDAGKRSSQERLARAGRSDQQNIALFNFDLGEWTELVDRCIEGCALLKDAFVVIVNRHREDLLGLLLPDDMLVELAHDFGGLRHANSGFLFRASSLSSLSRMPLQTVMQLSQM